MTEIVIRPAQETDVPEMHRLLAGLAAFQEQSDSFLATPEALARDGFGAAPRFEAILAEVDGKARGLALWFMTYSSFKARRCLFLDSLFVEEAARGHDLGRKLMAELARIALDRDCYRLDLGVLEWNPAREFYERLGLGWNRELGYTVSGAALQALAQE
jgi:GNAT superfamily N-acetyltransferase